MSLVFHRIKPNFGMGEMGQFPEDFQLVAEVATEDLEEVYHLTNHIDTDWTTNAGVTPKQERVRSTSVGDVVVLQNGSRHLCASCGWEAI